MRNLIPAAFVILGLLITSAALNMPGGNDRPAGIAFAAGDLANPTEGHKEVSGPSTTGAPTVPPLVDLETLRAGSGAAKLVGGDVPPSPPPTIGTDDPTGILQAIMSAAAAGRWGVVVVLVLLLVGVVLRVAAKRVKRLAFLLNRWWSWGLNFAIAFLAVVGGGMYLGHATFSVALVNVAIVSALAVAGGVQLFKDATGKSEPATAPAGDVALPLDSAVVLSAMRSPAGAEIIRQMLRDPALQTKLRQALTP